ncbi:hypothetical protein COCNU_08G009030 [Cocos nucifera]|uniref:protein-serine/threonine phosphatase n=1 Tax=Cocos nucifera TaxID=13894 RepID=A0A8K0N712_COCNU|nr:hypothetical protein COCNU_08G009030 [Cocos nucifera]
MQNFAFVNLSKSQYLVQNHQFLCNHYNHMTSFSYLHLMDSGSTLATKKQLILFITIPAFDMSFELSLPHQSAFLLSDSVKGSARRLVKAALHEAARKREMRYSDLKKIDRGVRRHFHDDITVIVVFLDSNLIAEDHGPPVGNLVIVWLAEGLVAGKKNITGFRGTAMADYFIIGKEVTPSFMDPFGTGIGV